MHAQKAVIWGNSFVGMFARANDKVILVPPNTPEKFDEKCAETLGVKVAHVTVCSSNLAGLFSAMNNNGVILSALAEREEAKRIGKLGVECDILKGRFSAAGNNILVNSRVAIVNPLMDSVDIKIIEDCLGVEVIGRTIAGYETPGSVGVVTDSGLLLHQAVEEDELKEIEEIFKVKGTAGTANMGTPFVGLCIVANSKGYLCGEATSGFEMAKIDEGLGFIEQ